MIVLYSYCVTNVIYKYVSLPKTTIEQLFVVGFFFKSSAETNYKEVTYVSRKLCALSGVGQHAASDIYCTVI